MKPTIFDQEHFQLKEGKEQLAGKGKNDLLE
jgi:hypothetical protein